VVKLGRKSIVLENTRKGGLGYSEGRGMVWQFQIGLGAGNGLIGRTVWLGQRRRGTIWNVIKETS
jgi:hypothetical protein